MQAIELETRIDKAGNIHLPERFRHAYGRSARLVVLLPDNPNETAEVVAPTQATDAPDMDGLLEATRHCWSGEDGLAYQRRLRSEWDREP